ncbi:hypothetical protein [Maribacter ulvicola]|uniref:hypothetical protein n=1 Tax=Maribacter ulvicola TaxID=228959 RepID=UPI00117F2D3C|nr:hypothetical protein [Maribacter ulvicola]
MNKITVSCILRNEFRPGTIVVINLNTVHSTNIWFFTFTTNSKINTNGTAYRMKYSQNLTMIKSLPDRCFKEQRKEHIQPILRILD